MTATTLGHRPTAQRHTTNTPGAVFLERGLVGLELAPVAQEMLRDILRTARRSETVMGALRQLLNRDVDLLSPDSVDALNCLIRMVDRAGDLTIVLDHSQVDDLMCDLTQALTEPVQCSYERGRFVCDNDAVSLDGRCKEHAL